MAHKWISPFNSLIVGASQSGKSTFIKRFLANLDEMIDVKIHEVIFCYGIAQKEHNELQDLVSCPLRLIEGLPDLDEISSLTSPPKVVILDDLISQLDGSTVDLFLRGSHHRSLNLLCSTQNLFSPNKHFRNISLNSHYIVLFNSPREKSQVQTFARQIEPRRVPYIMEAYHDATELPYSYMLFDLKQGTDQNLRYCTKIFPDEQTKYYVPKKR
jgi:hypothetical protein